MDLPDNPENILKINFDSGKSIQMDKAYLIDNSLYFTAMFSGKFIESKLENEIALKNLSEDGFMYIIKSLKCNHIDVVCLEELFLLLETSLILQFTEVFNKCMMIIEKSHLFTINSTIQIFSFTSVLGLEVLSDKARFYVLYNFKIFLMQNKNAFFELTKEELQLLLNDNGLNVNDETDVYNLILDWCTETHNYDNDVLYDMVISCVNFNSMSKSQLESCILKTKHSILQNTIKQLYQKDTFDVTDDMKTLLIKPPRIIPNALCVTKNDDDGYAYIYRWNWSTINFEKFIKINPLPRNSRGYQVVNKNLDIYVFDGKVCNEETEKWINCGWKYNLLTKQWKQLEYAIISKSCGRIARFCGNILHLDEDDGKHQLENTLIEQFTLDLEDKLVQILSCKNHFGSMLTPIVDSNMTISLNDKGRLVMVIKDLPMYTLSVNYRFLPNVYTWRSNNMNIKAKIICATTYRNRVYVLGFNSKRRIMLYIYYPERQFCKQIKTFKTVFNVYDTACSFNVNKVMVFGNKILECYSLDDNVYDEYMIDMNDRFQFFFNVPAY